MREHNHNLNHKKYHPLIPSWRKSRREGKKHNFGVKRSWEQRTFLNFKKQTPVNSFVWFSFLLIKNLTRWPSRTRVPTIWKSRRAQRGQSCRQGKAALCPRSTGTTTTWRRDLRWRNPSRWEQAQLKRALKKLGEMGATCEVLIEEMTIGGRRVKFVYWERQRGGN